MMTTIYNMKCASAQIWISLRIPYSSKIIIIKVSITNKNICTTIAPNPFHICQDIQSSQFDI